MKMTVVARVLISVLVVVLTARVSMCFRRNVTAEKIMERNFRKTVQLSDKFNCGPPQKRTIYLHEIVGEEVWKTEYMEKIESVHPYSVVLHRCENAGCCEKYNERCKSANETEVTLTFMYIRKSSGSTSTYEYRTHQAKNHTLCECQIISDKQIK